MPLLPGVVHRWVPVGDVVLHCAEAGPHQSRDGGSAVLLVHGWPQHWWCFRRILPVLAESRRVIAVDLRGQGWSSIPRSGYAEQDLVGDLLNLMDTLELPTATLVGHDWGGWLGFLACLREPNRFDGLVAMSTPHPWQRADRRLTDLWRWAYQPVLATPWVGARAHRAVPWVLRRGAARPVWSDDDLAVYADRFRDPDRARAGSALYRNLLVNLLGTLSSSNRQVLRTPTRLLVGDRDPVVTPRILDGWAEHSVDMTVTSVPGCGHFLPEEDPVSVLAAIDSLADEARKDPAFP